MSTSYSLVQEQAEAEWRLQLSRGGLVQLHEEQPALRAELDCSPYVPGYRQRAAAAAAEEEEEESSTAPDPSATAAELTAPRTEIQELKQLVLASLQNTDKKDRVTGGPVDGSGHEELPCTKGGDDVPVGDPLIGLERHVHAFLDVAIVVRDGHHALARAIGGGDGSNRADVPLVDFGDVQHGLAAFAFAPEHPQALSDIEGIDALRREGPRLRHRIQDLHIPVVVPHLHRVRRYVPWEPLLPELREYALIPASLWILAASFRAVLKHARGVRGPKDAHASAEVARAVGGEEKATEESANISQSPSSYTILKSGSGSAGACPGSSAAAMKPPHAESFAVLLRLPAAALRHWPPRQMILTRALVIRWEESHADAGHTSLRPTSQSFVGAGAGAGAGRGGIGGVGVGVGVGGGGARDAALTHACAASTSVTNPLARFAEPKRSRNGRAGPLALWSATNRTSRA
eukprot:CAMPEP_0170138910 /NCGR_PEP_ID=MMETSP0033_2-20121228/5279_1 /TAXON_ID=195969 /ORGANISM="Dolichomastix tenuilepis, Strain CCMP3274" /LENGTH=460 /DNA_ID=CAMNT_0010374975 /DNA_START=225 /DNA_END=1606 /DNA_ORIENTATION=-